MERKVTYSGVVENEGCGSVDWNCARLRFERWDTIDKLLQKSLALVAVSGFWPPWIISVSNSGVLRGSINWSEEQAQIAWAYLWNCCESAMTLIGKRCGSGQGWDRLYAYKRRWRASVPNSDHYTMIGKTSQKTWISNTGRWTVFHSERPLNVA